MIAEILRMENICKEFENKEDALHNACISVRSGEIHALVGKNGSGKSTLVRIISGALRADSGRIFFNENRVNLYTASAAQKLGIGVVFQTPSVVEELDIMQNIFLGNEKIRFYCGLHKKEMYDCARAMLDKMGIDINERTKMSELSYVQRQLVMLVKAINLRPKLLVMDETTASFTKYEFETIKKALQHIRNEGTSILFISHKIDEVLEVADRVTVLYDGVTMGTFDADKCSKKTILTAMTNGAGLEKSAENIMRHNYFKDTEELLKVCNVRAKYGVKNASLVLRKGEVLGIAGVVGSGRSTFLKLIYGIVPRVSGDIYVCGVKCENYLALEKMWAHMGLMPEEYLSSGLFCNMNISFNIMIAAMDTCARRGVIDLKKVETLADYYVKKLGINDNSHATKVKDLSGGNKQRVMLGRYMAAKPDILMLDEPMKGIDETSRADIVSYINRVKLEGRGIIITSEDPQELIYLCDRILIMKNGMITDEFTKGQASEMGILNAMTERR